MSIKSETYQVRSSCDDELSISKLHNIKTQQQQTNHKKYVNTRHFQQQTDKMKITKIKTGHDRFQNTEDLD